MRDLVIIGAGGFGREVQSMANYSNYGSVILCDSKATLTRDYMAIVAIGDPKTRKQVVSDFGSRSTFYSYGSWKSLFKSNISYIMDGCAEIGEGTIICAGVIISINCEMGRHVHINFACTIGHDCIIGDFVTISPGVHISGNVTIGDEVFIGTGTVIREKLTIGKGATIGMGAVVVKDVPPGVTVVGNPAREINEMSRKLYWPIRSKKAQAEPVAYENNQNNESGFLNPLLLGGVEDGYISYDGEKRKVHPDDVEKFMACVQEHRA